MGLLCFIGLRIDMQFPMDAWITIIVSTGRHTVGRTLFNLNQIRRVNTANMACDFNSNTNLAKKWVLVILYYRYLYVTTGSLGIVLIILCASFKVICSTDFCLLKRSHELWLLSESLPFWNNDFKKRYI